jgi:hypothetical protein
MDTQEEIDKNLKGPVYLDDAILQYKPEALLIKGRWLQIFGHDTGCEDGEHMHWYRQILGNYDSTSKEVLLSQKGSRRLRQELETPDREYSLQELLETSELSGSNIRGRDHTLF